MKIETVYTVRNVTTSLFMRLERIARYPQSCNVCPVRVRIKIREAHYADWVSDWCMRKICILSATVQLGASQTRLTFCKSTFPVDYVDLLHFRVRKFRNIGKENRYSPLLWLYAIPFFSRRLRDTLASLFDIRAPFFMNPKRMFVPT